MRVGIDGNCLLHPQGGVARYVEGLVSHLPGISGEGDTCVSVMTPSKVRRTIPWVLWSMQQISHNRFDILHYPFYYPCLWPRCPSTVAIHDVLVIEHPEWFPRAWGTATRLLLERGSQRAAAIVTGSKEVAAAIERTCRVPRTRIAVIPYGVDMAAFGPSAGQEAESVRRRFGLERPFLLQVGAFEPRRGVGLAIRAVRAIRAEMGDVDLVLVGDTRSPVPGLDASQAFVRRLGRVSDFDLAALYGAASAVLAPSFGEGFDLPVLEALACGAVVVASNIPVHVEHFAGAVELFDTGDAKSLANACVRALTDSARIASLRERGPRLASIFSWEACAQRHVELWRMVTGA